MGGKNRFPPPTELKSELLIIMLFFFARESKGKIRAARNFLPVSFVPPSQKRQTGDRAQGPVPARAARSKSRMLRLKVLSASEMTTNLRGWFLKDEIETAVTGRHLWKQSRDPARVPPGNEHRSCAAHPAPRLARWELSHPVSVSAKTAVKLAQALCNSPNRRHFISFFSHSTQFSSIFPLFSI